MSLQQLGGDWLQQPTTSFTLGFSPTHTTSQSPTHAPSGLTREGSLLKVAHGLRHALAGDVDVALLAVPPHLLTSNGQQQWGQVQQRTAHRR